MKILHHKLYLLHCISTRAIADQVKEIVRPLPHLLLMQTPCRGTVSRDVLAHLGLQDQHREYLRLILDGSGLAQFRKEIEKTALQRPGHGIFFVSGLTQAAVGETWIEARDEEGEDIKMKWKLITALVNYGEADAVIEAARQVGAYGATKVKAHGTVNESAARLFGFSVEPEKEEILFLVQAEQAEAIMQAIVSSGSLGEAGRGIVFAQDVLSAYGLSTPQMVE